MEDKTDDILVGDVKKKTSTAHSIMKKKFNQSNESTSRRTNAFS